MIKTLYILILFFGISCKKTNEIDLPTNENIKKDSLLSNQDLEKNDAKNVKFKYFKEEEGFFIYENYKIKEFNNKLRIYKNKKVFEIDFDGKEYEGPGFVISIFREKNIDNILIEATSEIGTSWYYSLIFKDDQITNSFFINEPRTDSEVYSVNDFINPSISGNQIVYQFEKSKIAPYSKTPNGLSNTKDYLYLRKSIENDIYLKTNKYLVKSISGKLTGKFTVSVEGDSTNHGMEMYEYQINILEHGISLHEVNRDFCGGSYKGIEKDNKLELYYIQDKDERCVRVNSNYTIKKEGEKFYIKGIGGEGTFHQWIELKKVNKFE